MCIRDSHYAIPVHLQPAYAEFGHGKGSLVHAEAASQRVLSLPMYPELTADHIRSVSQAVTTCLATAR